MDVIEIPQNPENEPTAAWRVGGGMRMIVIIIALVIVVVAGVLFAGAALNHSAPASGVAPQPDAGGGEERVFNLQPSGDQPGHAVVDDTSAQSAPPEQEVQRLEEERQLVEAQQKLNEQKQENLPQPADDPAMNVKPFTDFR